MHAVLLAFAAMAIYEELSTMESQTEGRRYLSRRAARLSTTTERGLGEMLHL
jgi:hypothetical protein